LIKVDLFIKLQIPMHYISLIKESISTSLERANATIFANLIEVLRLGFDPVYIPFERPKNIYGKSRWTFKKKISPF